MRQISKAMLKTGQTGGGGVRRPKETASHPQDQVKREVSAAPRPVGKESGTI